MCSWISASSAEGGSGETPLALALALVLVFALVFALELPRSSGRGTKAVSRSSSSGKGEVEPPNGEEKEKPERGKPGEDADVAEGVERVEENDAVAAVEGLGDCSLTLGASESGRRGPSDLTCSEISLTELPRRISASRFSKFARTSSSCAFRQFASAVPKGVAAASAAAAAAARTTAALAAAASSVSASKRFARRASDGCVIPAFATLALAADKSATDTRTCSTGARSVASAFSAAVSIAFAPSTASSNRRSA
mmetsp:Transcript_34579/g.75973  ORF Transcript_34579/g.75973 Transcript_34579/m.75973 type:complete len:254 (-) Transcript_34579:549-1310(-)